MEPARHAVPSRAARARRSTPGHVVGVLGTADPFVTVTSAVAAFSELLSGESTANLAMPFRVDVSSSAPNLQPVTFTVLLSSYGACTVGVFADTLYAPGTPVPEPTIPLPTTLALGPARPNPFTGETTLSFLVPSAGLAEMTVHDVAGRLVATLARRGMDAGWHASAWNGRVDGGGRAAAGIYFVRVRSGSEARTAKIVRLE